MFWFRRKLLGHSQSLGTLENLYSVLLGKCNVLILVMCLLNNWGRFPQVCYSESIVIHAG
jgi:hypothetical protein